MFTVKVEDINANIQKYFEKIEKVKNQYREIVEKSPLCEKRGPNYLFTCMVCGEKNLVKQYNGKQVPKVCFKCKETGNSCIICDVKIGFGRIYCKDCLGIAKKTELWGHSKQAKKMKGDKNPSKRPDVRLKLTAAQLKLYKSDPTLVDRRGRKSILKVLEMQRSRRSSSGFRSKFEEDVVEYFNQNNITFEYEPHLKINNKNVLPDFVVGNKIAIEVAGWILGGKDEEKCLKKYTDEVILLLNKFNHVIIITYEAYSGYFTKFFKGDSRVTVTSDPYSNKLKVTLIKEDICNVDYSHFLYFHDKACKRFHGHTSWNVSLSVEGFVIKGMVVDYGIIKEIVTRVLKDTLDHKLIVNRNHIKEEIGDIIVIEYMTDSFHRLELPKEEVFIIDEEPTNEHITDFFAHKILDEMPSNVTGIGLFLREGNNAGSLSFVDRPDYKFKKLKDVINFCIVS